MVNFFFPVATDLFFLLSQCIYIFTPGLQSFGQPLTLTLTSPLHDKRAVQVQSRTALSCIVYNLIYTHEPEPSSFSFVLGPLKFLLSLQQRIWNTKIDQFIEARSLIILINYSFNQLPLVGIGSQPSQQTRAGGPEQICLIGSRDIEN